jgi:hypothetical protein
LVAEPPSILSLSAVGLYTLILGACLFAAVTAGQYRQPFAHSRTWVMIAILFGVLALMRIVNAEDVLRDLLREVLRAEGGYAGRRDFQRTVLIVVIIAFIGLFLFGLWRQWRAAHGRRNMALFAAYAAVAIMLFLMALRIISLHQVDWILYGPTKLNWLVDIGSSLTVLAAAVFYVRLVKRRP